MPSANDTGRGSMQSAKSTRGERSSSENTVSMQRLLMVPVDREHVDIKLLMSTKSVQTKHHSKQRRERKEEVSAVPAPSTSSSD